MRSPTSTKISSHASQYGAGLKYFILGGIAGAIFLMGSAYLFGFSGSLNLEVIQQVMSSAGDGSLPSYFIFGSFFILVTFFFKVGAFPFHYWLPDVYHGSLTSVTMFMASIVKLSVFAALARVAGGGIHFSDEIYKNKKDLVQVYLGIIQNRCIEIDGYKWPIDSLIVATSNNSEFNRFLAEKEEAPIVDRCRICYVSHNTDYVLQKELTTYAIGNESKTTLTGDAMHQDPNLNYAASVAVVLSRLPRSEKLTPIETMKLAAGEVAGEKSLKTLSEVIDTLSQEHDITKRYGQKGLGQRNLGRSIQLMLESSETNEGKCMFAYDVFHAIERAILDYVSEAKDRTKFLDDLKIAKGLYRERIMTEMFNAYMDEPLAIRKDVMNYVNMIIGIDAENLGTDKMWKYKNPQTGELQALKIDERYINSVEDGLGLKTKEQKDSFRTSIRKIYGQKISVRPDYDFMDNLELVKAVTDVRLKSDIAGSGSLIGALANRTNEENQKLYDRMIQTMLHKLGYCTTCAQKTIEYFCTQVDEN